MNFLKELLEQISEKSSEKASGPEHKKFVSESKFLELLKERCRNSYNVIRRSPIYVSEKSDEDFIIVTPEKKEVKTSFWLDRMVQSMNAWKRFPSRKAYIRGFTSEDRADKLEGNVYVLIPYDHARVGICPKASFYRSFLVALKDLDLDRLDNDGLSRWVSGLTKSIKVLEPKAKFKEDVTPDTYAELMKVLKEIDSVVASKKDVLKKKLKEDDTINDEDRKLLKDLLQNHITDILSYLEGKLDPENNDFRAVRIESFSSPSDIREVWVDSPSLLVKLSTYKELYKRGVVK